MTSHTAMENVSTFQSWCEHGPKQSFFEPVFDGFLILLSILIVAINLLVMWAFVRKRQLHTKTNSLLMSLSVSDFLMGLLGIPSNIVCNATAGCANWLCISSVVVYRLIATSTIYHIFAITVERYISVLHPLDYLSLVTRPRIGRAIAAIWFFALFIAFIQLTWTDFSNFSSGLSGDPLRLKLALAYDAFGTLVCFLLPTLAMSFIYFRMFRVIRRQSLAIKRLHASVDHNIPSYISKAEARAITIFALMLGTFVCCWMTFYISAFQVYTNYYGVLSDGYIKFFEFLRLSTAFLNPVLYTFLKQDFRRSLSQLFSCCVKSRSEQTAFRTEDTPMVSQDLELQERREEL